MVMAALGATQIAGRHLSFPGIIEVSTRMTGEAQEAVLARAALRHRLARPQLRRVHRPARHPRDVGDRLAERYGRAGLHPGFFLALFGSALMLGARWPRERHGGDGRHPCRTAQGIADRQPARDLRVANGQIGFNSVTFRYGGHATPLASA